MSLLSKSQPLPNQLEVTLLGPGYGESIVIHVSNEWFVVDSCVEPDSKAPAAFWYLDYIGVPRTAVTLIACTHWHDDHSKGIAQIYAECKTAQLCVSSALAIEEFLELLTAYGGWPKEEGDLTSGVTEMRQLFMMSKARNAPPIYATHTQRLWMNNSASAELWSLSPSDKMRELATLQIAKLLPAAHESKLRVSAGGPNESAIAMHLRAGSHAVLLGSDLEEHGNALTGWSAVIGAHARPKLKAGLYKVAHHGSETAEHGGIWTDLLASNPESILTRFNKGKKPLPSPPDVKRIVEQSNRLFSTTQAGPKKLRRSGSVAKLVAPHNLKALTSSFGALRCRIDADNPNASWAIELHGDATDLT